MKRTKWIFKKNIALPLKGLIILVIGFVISFFLWKWLWKIIDNNAFDIVTEMLFPAGRYYASLEGKELQESSGKNIIETNENDEDAQNDSNSQEEESTTLDDTEEQDGQNNSSGNGQVATDNSVTAVAGSVHSIEELTDYDFVIKHFYVVASATTLTEEILNLDEITKMDLSIEKNTEGPQILIFHTHSQEWFSDTEQNGKTIVDAGNYLTKLLTEKYGYNVLHVTEEFDMKDGVLDRGTAYTYANQRIDELLAEYPSIEVIIDLHRDGVDESKHFVTEINGKQTAKIMLFNGISYTDEQGELDYINNPYRTENLAMTYQMYLIGEKLYPDLFRCIYIQGYRYCLHHLPRSLLIEAGAQTNTFEEVYNAMEPLAEILAVELGYEEK